MGRSFLWSMGGLLLAVYLLAVIIRGNGVIFLQAITTEKDFLRWGIAVIILLFIRDTYARGTEIGEIGIVLVNAAMLLTIPPEKLKNFEGSVNKFFGG